MGRFFATKLQRSIVSTSALPAQESCRLIRRRTSMMRATGQEGDVNHAQHPPKRKSKGCRGEAVRVVRRHSETEVLQVARRATGL